MRSFAAAEAAAQTCNSHGDDEMTASFVPQVDGWAEFRAPARIGVLVCALPFPAFVSLRDI